MAAKVQIYLYVKVHTKTGLMYFGKTTADNPYTYTGSGSYWQKHIKKHGLEHIITTKIWTFTDQEECTKFAIEFSKKNNIVESKSWANLRIENGRDGVLTGSRAWNKNKKMSEASRHKMSMAKRGKTPWNKGKSINVYIDRPELKAQQSERMKLWWAERKASALLAHGG